MTDIFEDKIFKDPDFLINNNRSSDTDNFYDENGDADLPLALFAIGMGYYPMVISAKYPIVANSEKHPVTTTSNDGNFTVVYNKAWQISFGLSKNEESREEVFYEYENCLESFENQIEGYLSTNFYLNSEYKLSNIALNFVKTLSNNFKSEEDIPIDELCQSYLSSCSLDSLRSEIFNLIRQEVLDNLKDYEMMSDSDEYSRLKNFIKKVSYV